MCRVCTILTHSLTYLAITDETWVTFADRSAQAVREGAVSIRVAEVVPTLAINWKREGIHENYTLDYIRFTLSKLDFFLGHDITVLCTLYFIYLLSCEHLRFKTFLITWAARILVRSDV